MKVQEFATRAILSLFVFTTTYSQAGTIATTMQSVMPTATATMSPTIAKAVGCGELTEKDKCTPQVCKSKDGKTIKNCTWDDEVTRDDGSKYKYEGCTCPVDRPAPPKKSPTPKKAEPVPSYTPIATPSFR